MSVEFSSSSFKPTVGTADSQGTPGFTAGPGHWSRTFLCNLTGGHHWVCSLLPATPPDAHEAVHARGCHVLPSGSAEHEQGARDTLSVTVCSRGVSVKAAPVGIPGDAFSLSLEVGKVTAYLGHVCTCQGRKWSLVPVSLNSQQGCCSHLFLDTVHPSASCGHCQHTDPRTQTGHSFPGARDLSSCTKVLLGVTKSG